MERVIENLELQISSAKEKKKQVRSSGFPKTAIKERCEDIDHYVAQLKTAIKVLKNKSVSNGLALNWCRNTN